MGGKVYDDLVEGIRERRVLVVVGAGIAVQATGNDPVASWIGLLRSGVARVADLDPTLADGWKRRQTDVLDAVAAGTADIKDLLGVAQQVSSRLGWPDDPEWVQWLRDTVGALTPTPTGRRVLEAIAALDVPIATTNYDGLLEEVTGLPPVTWTETGAVVKLLQGKEKGILHLHGFWNKPDSVVLGINSYDALIGHGTAQHVEKVLPTLFGLLYIGCGDGLADPNFAALRAWIRDALPGTEHRHIRLARECEVAALQKEHPREERTFVRAYGASFDDLAPYLEKLARAASPDRRSAAGGSAAAAPPAGFSPPPPRCPAGLSLWLVECKRQSARDSCVSAEISVPSQEHQPGEPLRVRLIAYFPHVTGDLLPLKEVHIGVKIPSRLRAEKRLGDDVEHECANGQRIRCIGPIKNRITWALRTPEVGGVLHGRDGNAKPLDDKPLFELPGAKIGDKIDLQVAAYPRNFDFADTTAALFSESDTLSLQKMRIIECLRLKEIGRPSMDGEIVLDASQSIVEEAP